MEETNVPQIFENVVDSSNVQPRRSVRARFK